MANKIWYQSIQDRHPATFGFDFDPFTTSDCIVKGTEDFGFKDNGDHYEMVTNLGGQKNEACDTGNATKVELTGKNGRTVEISYEYSSEKNDKYYYSHSQKTSVTLPADADESTLRAYYDDNDNVVVSVKKRVPEKAEKKVRNIPISKPGKE